MNQNTGSGQTERRPGSVIGTWIAIGAGGGVALGLALGNLALGIAIGGAIGTALGAAMAARHGAEEAAPGERRVPALLGLGLLLALLVLGMATLLSFLLR